MCGLSWSLEKTGVGESVIVEEEVSDLVLHVGGSHEEREGVSVDELCWIEGIG